MSDENCKRILKRLKEALRIITDGYKSGELVRNAFKEINILIVYSLYVYETAKHCKLAHLFQPIANTLITQETALL